ncbi:hypothetical protein [Enterococcus casseliflavus]|uniref:hypothetical protein n=1 Tax=Enterococcus casseliflavus TaxID=37734 RepID=UPI0034D30E8D
MKVKKIIDKKQFRIFLYLIVGIPTGILMIDNEFVFLLGGILLFFEAIRNSKSKLKNKGDKKNEQCNKTR